MPSDSSVPPRRSALVGVRVSVEYDDDTVGEATIAEYIPGAGRSILASKCWKITSDAGETTFANAKEVAESVIPLHRTRLTNWFKALVNCGNTAPFIAAVSASK